MGKNRKVLKYLPHEHLEFWVKKTTYSHRLQWLEEANDFVRKVESSRKSWQNKSVWIERSRFLEICLGIFDKAFVLLKSRGWLVSTLLRLNVFTFRLRRVLDGTRKDDPSLKSLPKMIFLFFYNLGGDWSRLEFDICRGGMPRKLGWPR